MTGPVARILVVESNPLSARIDQAILSSLFDLKVACSGAEAMALIEAGAEFDLALVSLSLPDMDALEVARFVRDRSGGQTVAAPLASPPRLRLLGQRGEWAALGTTSCMTRPLTGRAIADLLCGAVRPICVDRTMPNFAQLATLCRPGLEAVVQRLRRAARTFDVANIRESAHEVLGYCGLLQLPELATACRTVEEALDANLNATAARAVEVLLTRLSDLCGILREAEDAGGEGAAGENGGIPGFPMAGRTGSFGDQG